jgi:hypothetical protein
MPNGRGTKGESRNIETSAAIRCKAMSSSGINYLNAATIDQTRCGDNGDHAMRTLLTAIVDTEPRRGCR